ncbi:MAG TPA: hypothetical protein VGO47_10450, partial [Chlamydiales bacterium]|nr:hypothetical protein [Chlamydiales bacterium]
MTFFCLTSAMYDDTPLAGASSESLPSADFQVDQGGVYEHPCTPLTKILSSGTFYYAAYPHWDISTQLSERIKRSESDLGAFDERFVWNEYVVRSLLDFRDR